jgi:hypothetical protein
LGNRCCISTKGSGTFIGTGQCGKAGHCAATLSARANNPSDPVLRPGSVGPAHFVNCTVADAIKRAVLTSERWCLVHASSCIKLNGKQEGHPTGSDPTCAAPATVSGWMRMHAHPARASCHWESHSWEGRPSCSASPDTGQQEHSAQARCVVSVLAGKLARTTCGSFNHARFALATVGAAASCTPALR